MYRKRLDSPTRKVSLALWRESIFAFASLSALAESLEKEKKSHKRQAKGKLEIAVCLEPFQMIFSLFSFSVFQLFQLTEYTFRVGSERNFFLFILFISTSFRVGSCSRCSELLSRRRRIFPKTENYFGLENKRCELITTRADFPSLCKRQTRHLRQRARHRRLSMKNSYSRINSSTLRSFAL
jgi:hypothetical protein